MHSRLFTSTRADIRHPRLGNNHPHNHNHAPSASSAMHAAGPKPARGGGTTSPSLSSTGSSLGMGEALLANTGSSGGSFSYHLDSEGGGAARLLSPSGGGGGGGSSSGRGIPIPVLLTPGTSYAVPPSDGGSCYYSGGGHG